MNVRIVQEPPTALADYARVPIAFELRSVFDVTAPSVAGDAFVLSERPLATSTTKDYDAIPGEGPATWPSRFDLSTWALFAAYVDGARAGGNFLPSVGNNFGTDVLPNGTTFNSSGAFVEGVYAIGKYASAGARYDWFRPNMNVTSAHWAFTPFVNIALQNGLQFIAEWQHRDFEIAPAGAYHRQNNTFQIRLIFIQ